MQQTAPCQSKHGWMLTANTRINLEAAKGLHVLQTTEYRLPKLSSRKRRQSRTEGKMVSFSTAHMPQNADFRLALFVHIFVGRFQQSFID